MEANINAAMAGIAGVITVASITPGPNNLIVMRAAAKAGMVAALPAIAGIVLGSVALLGLILAGAHSAFASRPGLRALAAAAGCAYLCYLGARLVASSFAGATTSPVDERRSPEVMRLFVFQFLNPKSWALVLTASATVTAGVGLFQAFAELAAMLVLIATTCLLLWASSGSLLAGYLAIERNSRWFDRAMGLLLIVAALLTWSQT